MNNQSREENNSNNPRFTSSHHPFLQPIFPPNPNLFTQQNPSSQPIFPPNPAIFSPNLSFQPGFPPPWIPLNPFSPQLYPIIPPFPPRTSEQTSTKDQKSPKLEHVDKSSVTNINPIKSPNPTREIEKTFQNSKRVLAIKEQPQMIYKHPYQKRSMMERIDKWRKLKGVGGFGGFSIPPYIPMAQIKFSPCEHTLSDHYKCEEERAKKKKKIASHWQRLEVLKDVSTVDKFGDLLRTAYLERGISIEPLSLDQGKAYATQEHYMLLFLKQFNMEWSKIGTFFFDRSINSLKKKYKKLKRKINRARLEGAYDASDATNFIIQWSVDDLTFSEITNISTLTSTVSITFPETWTNSDLFHKMIMKLGQLSPSKPLPLRQAQPSSNKSNVPTTPGEPYSQSEEDLIVTSLRKGMNLEQIYRDYFTHRTFQSLKNKVRRLRKRQLYHKQQPTKKRLNKRRMVPNSTVSTDSKELRKPFWHDDTVDRLNKICPVSCFTKNGLKIPTQSWFTLSVRQRCPSTKPPPSKKELVEKVWSKLETWKKTPCKCGNSKFKRTVCSFNGRKFGLEKKKLVQEFKEVSALEESLIMLQENEVSSSTTAENEVSSSATAVNEVNSSTTAENEVNSSTIAENGVSSSTTAENGVNSSTTAESKEKADDTIEKLLKQIYTSFSISNEDNYFVRTKKVRLKLTSEQKKVFERFFFNSNHAYNEACLLYFMLEQNKGKTLLTTTEDDYFKILKNPQTNLRFKQTRWLWDQELKHCPADIKLNAVKDFVKAEKITRYKNKQAAEKESKEAARKAKNQFFKDVQKGKKEMITDEELNERFNPKHFTRQPREFEMKGRSNQHPYQSFKVRDISLSQEGVLLKPTFFKGKENACPSKKSKDHLLKFYYPARARKWLKEEIDNKKFSHETTFIRERGRYFVCLPVRYHKALTRQEYQRFDKSFYESNSNSGIEYDKIFLKGCPQPSQDELRKEYIALDPGVRCFMYGYDSNGDALEFAAQGENTILFSLSLKQDQLRSEIAKNKFLKYNSRQERKFYKGLRKALKKKIRRLESKIRNKVNDMHNKIIDYLTFHYSEIIIPEFNVKAMIARKQKQRKRQGKEDTTCQGQEGYTNGQTENMDVRTEPLVASSSPFEGWESRDTTTSETTTNTSEWVGRKITRKTVRQMLRFRHYDFRMKLLQKAEMRGCKVHVVTEQYTSKTCGNCSVIKEDLYGSKWFHCNHCHFHIPRDGNGARNILIKNYHHLLHW
ncbi:hypothetical protein C9374_003833 [Naegleria lovaniensis]|uniref:Cas12f1-like TNB domain-containing protein n=1 Tax=Naegleria lovaniensis TaxID=51637 RepID=A0AA88H621_NAELO|nr:uncharacterized protein C9374_003833 [Naegleria lovaniensis]KAG2394069.1 hypothetical protein C9374_003833 [Naegleria lovaniensis]